jgi:hypothetical protein
MPDLFKSNAVRPIIISLFKELITAYLKPITLDFLPATPLSGAGQLS